MLTGYVGSKMASSAFAPTGELDRNPRLARLKTSVPTSPGRGIASVRGASARHAIADERERMDMVVKGREKVLGR